MARSRPAGSSRVVRAGTQNPHVPTRPLTALSLYSGAGGLDLGFARAGFDLLWAIDSDPFAVATYHENLSEHAVCGTLPQTNPPGELRPDVVIGGPPCQG